MMKKIESLESQIKELSDNFIQTKKELLLLSRNFFEMTKLLREKTIIQQQLVEQIVVMSEAIGELQKSKKDHLILKYDMPNEPYN